MPSPGAGGRGDDLDNAEKCRQLSVVALNLSALNDLPATMIHPPGMALA